MRQKSGPEGSAKKHVKGICRKSRRKFSAQEKIRIVLEGLCGEYSIAELCRREGIYYTWSKEFLEAGKKRSFDGLYRSEALGMCIVPGTSE